ncbi:hypothetical protein QQF64_005787 [Cirrhinus molitorella]|uniref:Uncharacterized protein n=1 Tax=Cirrhinus molitorella TaxID=172907 RepID=A0ABR3MD79_9TELE
MHGRAACGDRHCSACSSVIITETWTASLVRALQQRAQGNLMQPLHVHPVGALYLLCE